MDIYEIIKPGMTDQEALEAVEPELVRLSGGDEHKLWRLRKALAALMRETRDIKNPLVRAQKAYDKMIGELL